MTISQFDRRFHPPALPSINLQLSPDIASSVAPAINPPTFIGDRSSGCAVDPTSDLRRILHPSAVPAINLRLSSAVSPSGSAFRSTFDFRRRSTFRPCLRTQPPTCIGCRALRLSLPIDLRLSPPINPPALPSNSTSDLHRLLRPPAQPSDRPATFAADQPSGPAFELNNRLPTGSSVELDSRSVAPVHASAKHTTYVDFTSGTLTS